MCIIFDKLKHAIGESVILTLKNKIYFKKNYCCLPVYKQRLNLG
jgi:hypothetical protein